MTTHFFVVNTDGDITRTGTCPKSMLALQAGVNETVIAGEADVMLNNYDFATQSVISRTPANADMAVRVKFERGVLIAASDWTQLPDVPIVTKDAWAIYRQALRDITLQTGYPQTIVWPAPPV